MSLSEMNEEQRFAYYRENGFTEDALLDPDWLIRLKAYRVFGFTQGALNDKELVIRVHAREALTNT